MFEDQPFASWLLGRRKSNQSAQDAYFASYAEARGYLEAIADRLDNARAPDENTDWGHVAEMQHLASQLKAIAEPQS